MYLQHWGLSRSPFAPQPDAPYPSLALSEATARVDYLVAQRRRLGVLLGDRGWGKTTTLGAIAAEQRLQGAEVAWIDPAGLGARELLIRTAEGLGATPDLADPVPRLWRRVEDRLAENRWQGRASVLLVDDADELGPDAAQLLRRLARLERGADASWTLLLAMPSHALNRLDESLLHLVDLRIDLCRWSQEETIGYVQASLIDAGRLEPVFYDSALTRIHERTEGVPRHVARLADFALLTGAGQGAQQIDVGLVDQALSEIQWTREPAASTVA